MSVVILPAAHFDLFEIWDHIATDSTAQADKMSEKFDRAFFRIAENPQMGRVRDELKAGIRSFPVGRYVIFYTVGVDSIQIARVLHSARDIKALLNS